jgi:hypothetical protein
MTCSPTESSALPGTPGTYTHTLARLIQLAKQPAWKAWAWNYAKKLDSDPSRYFRGIAEDLKSAMTGPEKVLESVDPSSEKRL